jgi:ectoine hydroxylase-related dioxygenase (phytanoyl-CoA dioxygenase family)
MSESVKELSQEQMDFYQEEGYLIVENVFTPSDFEPFIGELNALIDQKAKKAQSQGKLECLFEDEPFARRLACLGKQIDLKEIWPYTFLKYHSAEFFALMSHPALLTIIESVIGPEILTHSQFTLRAKLPRQEATVVPWHQDLAYLKADAVDSDMVNTWIPLVDATTENGCMQMIPKSHKLGLIEHKGSKYYPFGIQEEDLPSEGIVTCEVPQGGVILASNRTIHRSIANVSDHVRWSIDIRYCNPEQPTGRSAVPGFISQSLKRPDAFTTEYAQWKNLINECLEKAVATDDKESEEILRTYVYD